MIAPCRFDDDSSQMRVARFGDAPAPGPLSAGILAGHSTAVSHQLPSTVEAGHLAQHRLHKRYMRLAAAGKDKRKITTSVARELLGFIWAIGTRAETTVRQRIAA